MQPDEFAIEAERRRAGGEAEDDGAAFLLAGADERGDFLRDDA